MISRKNYLLLNIVIIVIITIATIYNESTKLSLLGIFFILYILFSEYMYDVVRKQATDNIEDIKDIHTNSIEVSTTAMTALLEINDIRGIGCNKDNLILYYDNENVVYDISEYDKIYNDGYVGIDKHMVVEKLKEDISNTTVRKDMPDRISDIFRIWVILRVMRRNKDMI